MPLLPVLLAMEFNGTFVNGKMLETMSIELGKKIDRLVNDIQNEAGTEFNVNSTQQLASVLFDIKGLPEIKKRSTAENVLHRLKNENLIPGLILEYRKLNKLKNTYIDAVSYTHLTLPTILLV